MTPQEIEKLLGGYATNTLSSEERTALFDAALGNQTLFDALADEQALKELLDDPRCRRQLLEALEQRAREPWLRRTSAWMTRGPVVALAGAAALGLIVAVSVRVNPPAREHRQVAIARPQLADSRAEAPAAPVPQPSAAAPAEKDDGRRAAKPAKKETLEPAVPSSNLPPPAALPAPPPVQPASPVAPPPAAAAESAAVAQSKAADAASPAIALRRASSARADSARDLYYGPETGVAANAFAERPRAATRGVVGGIAGAAAAGKIPGVRYSTMRRAADGSFAEVAPGAVFQAGDALRLRFESNQQGILSVMERGAAGSWSLRMGARLREGEPVYMPSESTITLRQAGEIQLFVMFSREQAAPARMERAVSTPNLQSSAENSTYVVNPAADAGANLAFPITLRFQ
jgi:hypothetical protein